MHRKGGTYLRELRSVVATGVYKAGAVAISSVHIQGKLSLSLRVLIFQSCFTLDE